MQQILKKREQLLTQISTLEFLHQRVSHCRCLENPQKSVKEIPL